MKVAVLTVNDIKISRWRWWSNWIDIAVFDFAGAGHLLQMRISRTNAKQFRCRKFASPFSMGVPYASASQAGDLVHMSKPIIRVFNECEERENGN